MKTTENALVQGTRAAAIIACLLALVMAAGCAAAKVSHRQQFVTGQLPMPGQIWVASFSATAADVPPNSALAGMVADRPQTAEEVAAGRELGTLIAANLVREIREMGLPAALATPDSTFQVNDIVIRGYLLSVDGGSAAKRIIIGFGEGASHLTTAVEGFEVIPDGMRPLGMGDVTAGGNKVPGEAVGVATMIATANPAGFIVSTVAHVYGEASGTSTAEGRARQTAKEIGVVLKKRFKEQGWIQ